MAAPKSVWGLDIGQCALKAIKLREVGGQLEAEGFDIVEHPTVLSAPDADPKELINQSLEQFLSRNDLSNCHVAVSVPGQSSFTRFVKLPQVDAKKIPQLVSFEAEQQIPFDMNEVIWRWQGFSDPDSPDLNVGLFAMKRQSVYEAMRPFDELDVGVNLVQLAGLSLYNFGVYDRQAADEGATLMVDLGASGTELVVIDGPRLWTRTLQRGGNDFTEALVGSFNLSFDKAEKLKRTAASSKYARQVFQSMRPIFADLVQDIQRSIGYYSSLRRGVRFTRIVGVGNGFRLPGLQKFLEQNLNIPVARVDSFNALQTNTTTSDARFTENLPSFAVAYGLAVQGLDLAEVSTNLLPDEISSARRWKKKRPWFGAAAGLLMLAMLSWGMRAMSDNKILAAKTPALQRVEEIDNEFKQLRREYESVHREANQTGGNVQGLLGLTKYNRVWPSIQQLLFSSIADAARHQSMLEADKIDQLKNVPAAQRRYVSLISMTSEFIAEPESATAAMELLSSKASNSDLRTSFNTGGDAFGMGGYDSYESSALDGILILMTARCPLDEGATTTLVNDILANSEARAKQILGDKVELVAKKLVEFDPAGAAAPVGGRRGGGAMTMPGGGAMTMPGGGAMTMPGGTMTMPGSSPRMSSAVSIDPTQAVNTERDFADTDITQYKTFVVGWIFKVVREDEMPL